MHARVRACEHVYIRAYACVCVYAGMGTQPTWLMKRPLMSMCSVGALLMSHSKRMMTSSVLTKSIPWSSSSVPPVTGPMRGYRSIRVYEGPTNASMLSVYVSEAHCVPQPEKRIIWLFFTSKTRSTSLRGDGGLPRMLGDDLERVGVCVCVGGGGGGGVCMFM